MHVSPNRRIKVNFQVLLTFVAKRVVQVELCMLLFADKIFHYSGGKPVGQEVSRKGHKEWGPCL